MSCMIINIYTYLPSCTNKASLDTSSDKYPPPDVVIDVSCFAAGCKPLSKQEFNYCKVISAKYSQQTTLNSPVKMSYRESIAGSKSCFKAYQIKFTSPDFIQWHEVNQIVCTGIMIHIKICWKRLPALLVYPIWNVIRFYIFWRVGFQTLCTCKPAYKQVTVTAVASWGNFIRHQTTSLKWHNSYQDIWMEAGKSCYDMM